jgi:hypothetical protein
MPHQGVLFENLSGTIVSVHLGLRVHFSGNARAPQARNSLAQWRKPWVAEKKIPSALPKARA